jgi:hypothetical protein
MNELIRLALKRFPYEFKDLPWKKCFGMMKVKLNGPTFDHIDARTWVVCFNRLNRVRRGIEGQSMQELLFTNQGPTSPITAKGMNIDLNRKGKPEPKLNRTGAEVKPNRSRRRRGGV